MAQLGTVLDLMLALEVIRSLKTTYRDEGVIFLWEIQMNEMAANLRGRVLEYAIRQLGEPR